MSLVIPLAGDVYHGSFPVPIGLIEVVGIFLHLSVERNQSFIVDARTVSFAPVCCSEVEHIPYKRSPYKRPFVYDFPVLHVVECLPVFGMPCTGRHRTLQGILLVVDTGSGSVFADSDTKLRMPAVGFIQKARQFFGHTAVPSVVAVPCNTVGDEVQCSVLIAGRGSRTGTVFLMCQLVQLLKIVHRIVSFLFQFVEQSP